MKIIDRLKASFAEEWMKERRKFMDDAVGWKDLLNEGGMFSKQSTQTINIIYQLCFFVPLSIVGALSFFPDPFGANNQRLVAPLLFVSILFLWVIVGYFWAQERFRRIGLKSTIQYVEELRAYIVPRLDEIEGRSGQSFSVDAPEPPEIEVPISDPSDRPLLTRERNTLLTIIAILCKDAGYDATKHAKTAVLIESAAAKMGISIGETTIEVHLKKIPDALATRMK